jgi:hypothetical protein
MCFDYCFNLFNSRLIGYNTRSNDHIHDNSNIIQSENSLNIPTDSLIDETPNKSNDQKKECEYITNSNPEFWVGKYYQLYICDIKDYKHKNN